MTFRMLFLFCLVFMSPSQALGSIDFKSVFAQNEHCVGYQTQKTLFFIRTVNVFGKNCDISSQIIPEPGSRSYVEVSIPVLSFESGEIERDRDVAKLLRVDDSKEIIFKSESLKNSEWKKIRSDNGFIVSGLLFIGKKPYPIEAKLSLKKRENGNFQIKGVVNTSFKNFNIKPPRLWGGIGARVGDKLSLLFQLNAEKTLGASNFL